MARPSLSVVNSGPPAEPLFEVRNAIGLNVFTANDAAIARRWARAKAPKLGDLTVEEVTVTVSEVRRRVYTARERAADLQLVQREREDASPAVAVRAAR